MDPDFGGRVAYCVDPGAVEAFDVLGSTIEFLVSAHACEHAPCVMRGTIPPGGFVPLHSHPDPETYLPVSGELEGLVPSDERFRWIPIAPGEVFHVPHGARHAFRNQSEQPAVAFILSTARRGRFFREIGVPLVEGAPPSGPPSGEAVRRFLEVAEKYGHWNATPEENVRAGIYLPPE